MPINISLNTTFFENRKYVRIYGIINVAAVNLVDKASPKDIPAKTKYKNLALLKYFISKYKLAIIQKTNVISYL